MSLKKNLRLRITCIITSLVLLLFVANTVISVINSKHRFENLAEEKYTAVTDYYAGKMDNWFSSNGAALMSLVAYVDSYEGNNIADMHNYFASFLAAYDDINEVYYGMDDDSSVFGEYVPPEDFKISTRPWYSAAKNTDGIYYTEPYMDAITQSLCISMCCAGKNGVVGMDLNLNALTGDMPVPDNGYTILATDQDTIVVHENPEFALSETTAQSLNDVLNGSYKNAIESKSSFEDYNGKSSYITSSVVPANNWIVSIVTPKSVYDAPINNMILIFVILTVIFCIITLIVVSIVSFRITKPISAMNNKLRKIVTDIRNGNGDLTMRLEHKSADEIGMISGSVNELMVELDKLIPKSKSAANSLAGHSESLVKVTEKLTGAMSGISQAVDDIANGATQQASDVMSANENVEHIGNVIDNVADSTGELNEIATNMQNSSLESENQIRNLQESTDTMVKGIERISGQIKDTSRAVDSINEKVSAISEIASQTNLLSLNASIEAARAGDMGKGFAVVAEEIGKLAIDSAQAAESIKDEMEGLLKSSQMTVDESNRVHQLTVTQQDVLAETTNTIKSLLNQIESTIRHINNIKEGVNQCVSAKEVIVDVMDSLSTISEQNAAASEETSATTIEIFSTIETLSGSAEELYAVATELNESLSVFK